MKKTIAIYPGSFNPFTVGHQNILEKAERIFGKGNVIVSVGINPEKIKHVGNHELEMVKNNKVKSLEIQLPSKNIEGYIGFLTDYVREKEEEGYNVVVIRGLRNGYDFDYEYNSLRYIWDQKPDLNLICIFCDPVFMHVSSSGYKTLESVKKGSGYKYLAIDRINPML